MKINTHIKLDNGISFSIIELDEPIVQKNFDNRFQVAVEKNGKRFFPKLKRRFFEFTQNFYFYPIKSDKSDKNVILDEKTYHLKQIFDRSHDDCMNEIESYISLHNNGDNVQKLLIKNYI